MKKPRLSGLFLVGFFGLATVFAALPGHLFS
jgi:hypothetical protein